MQKKFNLAKPLADVIPGYKAARWPQEGEKGQEEEGAGVEKGKGQVQGTVGPVLSAIVRGQRDGTGAKLTLSTAAKLILRSD